MLKYSYCKKVYCDKLTLYGPSDFKPWHLFTSEYGLIISETDNILGFLLTKVSRIHTEFKGKMSSNERQLFGQKRHVNDTDQSGTSDRFMLTETGQNLV